MVETRDVPVKMTANAVGEPDRKRDRSMTEDELFEFITAEPRVFGRKPVIRRMRNAVEHVLGKLKFRPGWFRVGFVDGIVALNGGRPNLGESSTGNAAFERQLNRLARLRQRVNPEILGKKRE
jgi:hypothetical protein